MYTMLKLSKTSSPQKLFDYDYDIWKINAKPLLAARGGGQGQGASLGKNVKKKYTLADNVH